MEWKDLIYDSVKERDCPLIVSEKEEVIPAKSLWLEIRRWVKIFREYGLTKGDRISLEMTDLFTYLGALLAGIWEEHQIIINNSGVSSSKNRIFIPDIILKDNSIIENDSITYPFDEDIEKYSEARIVFLKSDTFTAFLDDDLMNILNSFQIKNKFLGSRVLSMSSWFEESGIIQELLPGIFWADVIVQGSSKGRVSDTLEIKKKYLINLIRGGKDPQKGNGQLILF
ncbi:hypothetical protein OAK75_04180 [Bacteriovoracales bacterium]|nr:hypothetical protein [Bacteriovoracales bacterium]